MVCILAANKIWHAKLATNLQKRTAKKFITITNPTELTEKFLSDHNPDYLFFPHWSHRIPAAIFNQFECVIFHMTDLPFGRGGTPLQNLVVNGIYQTQITALRCEETIDSGPIYLKKPLSLQGRAQDIYYHANLLIEEMIVEIITNQLKPQPQQGEPFYFARRLPEEGCLAQVDELDQAYDYIRMLDAEHYPKAFIETENLKFEFSRAIFNGHQILADVIITSKEKKDG